MGKYFFLLFVVFSNLLYAQRQELDSIMLVIHQYEKNTGYLSDTNYLDAFNELGYRIHNINPDSTLMIGNQGLELCRNIGYGKGIVESMRNIGIGYYVKGNYIQAFPYYFDALAIAENIDYKMGIGRIYNNIANIYKNQFKYSLALEYYFKSLNVKDLINDKEGSARSLDNIAEIYYRQGRYEDALKYYKESSSIFKELGDWQGIAYGFDGMAGIYYQQGKYKTAIENQLEALSIRKKVGDKRGIAWSMEGLGKYYLALKEYDTAIKYSQESLELAQSIGLKDRIRDCNETLSKIYEGLDDGMKALYHHQQFKLYADSLNNKESENKTAQLQAQYEYDKKTNALKEEQTKQATEYERQVNQQQWIIFSVFAGLFSALVVVFLIFRSRKKLQQAYFSLEIANEEIHHQKNELEAKSKELQLTNEQLNMQKEETQMLNDHLEKTVLERTKELEITIGNLVEQNENLEQFSYIISHNLRAPVVRIQGLVNIFNQENMNDEFNKEVLDYLQQASVELDTVIKDLTEIISIKKSLNMNKEIIDIEEIINKELANLGTEIKQSEALIEKELGILSVYSIKAYMQSILHNLISNAIKYKYSRRKLHILIKTTLSGNDFCLTVQDNGLGVDVIDNYKIFGLYQRMHTHVEGKGLGLYLVKTQIETMKGRIEVESVINQGTTFKVYLPNFVQMED